MTLAVTILSVLMAIFVTTMRVKRAKQPTSLKQIVLPPIFMSTGFIMFFYPPLQVDWSYAIESFFLGVVLSLPLIFTTKFEVKGPDIYIKRSKLFIFILLGLFLTRMTMRYFIEEYVSFYEASGFFYIMAIGMIFPWRAAMLFRYLQIVRGIKNGSVT